MSEAAGRTCPLHYRYGAEAIAHAPVITAETLYVVGGLYGNLPALTAIEAMAGAEPGPVSISWRKFRRPSCQDFCSGDLTRHGEKW